MLMRCIPTDLRTILALKGVLRETATHHDTVDKTKHEKLPHVVVVAKQPANMKTPLTVAARELCPQRRLMASGTKLHQYRSATLTIKRTHAHLF